MAAKSPKAAGNERRRKPVRVKVQDNGTVPPPWLVKVMSKRPGRSAVKLFRPLRDAHASLRGLPGAEWLNRWRYQALEDAVDNKSTADLRLKIGQMTGPKALDFLDRLDALERAIAGNDPDAYLLAFQLGRLSLGWSMPSSFRHVMKLAQQDRAVRIGGMSTAKLSPDLKQQVVERLSRLRSEGHSKRGAAMIVRTWLKDSVSLRTIQNLAT